MSLRHRFPDFQVRPQDHLREPNRTPPKLTDPFPVTFKKGGNLQQVLDSIQAHRYVRINAATRAGKSVRLPLEIVRGGVRLVIHTVPSQLLAHSLFAHVSKAGDVPVTEVHDLTVGVPTEGLVIMSNTVYLTWVAFSGANIPPHCLYMDESHESDAATAVVRDTALSKPYVERLVLASATADPNGFRRGEAISVVSYPAGRVPSTWKPTDAGQPWFHENLNSNTLLFVERQTDIDRLMAAYSDYGFACYCMNAKTSIREFDATVKALQQPKAPVSLLFVDYSFRSGFSLPVTTIIDGGEVAFVQVSDGVVSRRFRRPYAGEIEQAIGRVGRLPGFSARAYVPNVEPLWAVCDLEGVESDAAALLFRYIGYKPPLYFNSSPMSQGAVPANLCVALNGLTPLKQLPSSSLTVWPGVVSRDTVPHIELRAQLDKGKALADAHSRSVTPVASPVVSRAASPCFPLSPMSRGLGAGLIERDCLAAVNDKLGSFDSRRSSFVGGDTGSVSSIGEVRQPSLVVSSVDVTQKRDVQETVELDVEDRSKFALDDALGTYEQLLRELQVTNTNIVIGEYYYHVGVTKPVGFNLAFPRGLESVMEIAVRKDFAQICRGLSKVDQMYAIDLVLSAYNHATAELNAVKQLIIALPSYKHKFGETVDKRVVTDWMTGLAEVSTACGSVVAEYSRILHVLDPGGYSKLDPLIDIEKSMVDRHVAQLSNAICETPVGEVDRYRDRLRDTWSITDNLRLIDSSSYIEPVGRKQIGFDSHVRRMLSPGITGSRNDPGVRGKIWTSSFLGLIKKD